VAKRFSAQNKRIHSDADEMASIASQLVAVLDQRRLAAEAGFWFLFSFLVLVFKTFQFDGMVAGYQAAAPAHEHLTEFDLIVYMLQDELADYVAANNEQAWFHSTFNGKRSKFMGSKCSVLVKLTPEKLFVSHDTWYDFNSMLRVFKNYKFGTGPLVSFSSYPLLPMSGDDYVITSNELAIVETTLNIFNNSLYNEYFKTDTVPYWLRVQLANKAKSAPEWHQVREREKKKTLAHSKKKKRFSAL
jgi:hypothetical protein